MKETFNTLGRNIDGMASTGRNPCHLHPDDLAALGVAAGSLIEIRSRHGSVVAIADADHTLRPGVVSLSHCFGTLPSEPDDPYSSGSSVSRLLSVDEALQPISLMPHMSAVPVRITRLPSV
jgi:anaerobic selenocysteine-containing dehydrogenase